MSKYDKVWNTVLSLIEEDTTPISFETWFKQPLSVRKIDNELNIVYLDVHSGENMDNEFILDLIEKRYLVLLQKSFKEVLGETYQVVLKPFEDEKNENESLHEHVHVKENKGKRQKKNTLNKENILNPKYTFDNFIVGPSNRYAYAAAQAVAESPGVASNPLFIYGGSGLGKTHLIQAIGTYILTENPELNVLYTDAENFASELVSAIQEKKTADFKSKYRKVDVLIIDDIQFIAGKESTQDEFFYTFNQLYNKNKQIIITSDKSPSKLTDIDERLITRFQWNLMADIQPADYETRVAILLKLAENNNMVIDEDLKEVIYLIAEKIKDNIRELEGAFNRITFFAKQTNEHPDKVFAKRILKDILSNNEIAVTPEKIKKAVCKYYNIKITELESLKRTNNIAFPRQVAMYLIRELTDSSLPQIGRYFGNRHYTTVMYACEKIEDEIKHDISFSSLIEELKNEIRE